MTPDQLDLLSEMIVNKLYSIKVDNNDVELSIYAPTEYDMVVKLFDEILIKNNIDHTILRNLTASLFISMLPLHKDDEDRFLILGILGSIIFNNIDFNKFILKI